MKMAGGSSSGETDVCFKHGVRFHIAGVPNRITPGTLWVMVPPQEPGGICVMPVDPTDWPEWLNEEMVDLMVTAVMVHSSDDLDMAVDAISKHTSLAADLPFNSQWCSGIQFPGEDKIQTKEGWEVLRRLTPGHESKAMPGERNSVS